MERRSTSAEYTHFGGDITAQVNSSHGVRLSGGSTGGIVEAVGDDTNVTLTIKAQGIGTVSVGDSSNTVVLNGGSVRIGNGSTSTFARMERYRIDWTVPALSSAGVTAGSADSTVTVVGITTNSILLFGQTQVWNSTGDPAIFVTVRCSTADELKITTHNIGAAALSGSTKSGTLLEFRF